MGQHSQGGSNQISNPIHHLVRRRQRDNNEIYNLMPSQRAGVVTLPGVKMIEPGRSDEQGRNVLQTTTHEQAQDRSASGSFATLAAIRRASSHVSSFAACVIAMPRHVSTPYCRHLSLGW